MKIGIFMIIILSMLSCGKKNSSAASADNETQFNSPEFLVSSLQNRLLIDQTGKLQLEIFPDNYFTIYKTHSQREISVGTWSMQQQKIILENAGAAFISDCIEMINETISGPLAKYLYRQGYTESSRLIFCPAN